MNPIWDEYRRRRRSFRLSLIRAPVWILLGAVINRVLVGFGLGLSDSVNFLVIALPVVISIKVPYYKWLLWPCPRCGQPFHFSWVYDTWFSNFAWVRKCGHCGLPRWSEEGYDFPHEEWARGGD